MTELPSINQPETPGQNQVLPDVSLPIAEFDSPNSPEKAVTQEHQRQAVGAARKILAGTAAVFSAVTLAAGKAEARTSQGIQANTPVAIDSGKTELSSSDEIKGKIPDYEYTKKWVESWMSKENKVYPVAFNGVVVFDAAAKIARYIDPYNPTKPRHFTTMGFDAGSKDPEKWKAAGARPLMKVDFNNNMWLGINDASNPIDGAADAYHMSASGPAYIKNQASVRTLNSWRWILYDPRHVWLYNYTANIDSPGGKFTYLALAAMEDSPIDPNYLYLTAHGLAGNFVPLFVNGIKPERIATWLTNYTRKDSQGKLFTVGGEYIPSQKIPSALRYEHTKPYSLPGINTVKKLMKDSLKGPVYKGND